MILSPIEQSIKSKIEKIGVPLKNWRISINYGIKTGLNDAFIINEQKRKEILADCKDAAERDRTTRLMRPTLRGRDIRRYSYEWANLYLLFIPWHFPLHKDESIVGASKRAEFEFQKQYPAIFTHLLQHKKELSARNKEEVNVRYEWYALQRWASNYMDDFSKPKIIWGDISDIPKFALDGKGEFFCSNTVYFMTGSSLEFLFCYLNSPLSEYLFSKIGSSTGVGTIRWQSFTVEQLFVPQIAPNDEKEFVRLFTQLKHGRANEREINQHIYSLCDLTKSEIAFIENYSMRA